MLTEDLKSDVEHLSLQDRHELSMYMIKLQLEADQEYLKTIRARTESYNSRGHIAVDEL